MSYDYVFLKGKSGGSLEGLAESATSGSLGTTDGVQASISALFPQMRWAKSPLADVPGWFGRSGLAEVQIIGGSEGQVVVLSMSRCERADAERVAKALGLIAIDEQTMERFGG
jgi:hypothetical protein